MTETTNELERRNPSRDLVEWVRSDETRAQIAGDSKTAGSSRESISAASSIGCDQQRPATSSINVPDASATSIACSPLRRKRM